MSEHWDWSADKYGWYLTTGDPDDPKAHKLARKEAAEYVAALTARAALADMGAEVHAFTVSRGWWQNDLAIRIPRLIKWLHEEADEAGDAFEDRGTESGYAFDADGLVKPEGLAAELADVYLIIQDIAHGTGLDLTAAVREKLDYNKVRRYKRDAEGNAL